MGIDQGTIDAWVKDTFGIDPAQLIAQEPAKSDAADQGGAPASRHSDADASPAGGGSANWNMNDASEEAMLEQRLTGPVANYPGRDKDEARLKELKSKHAAPPQPPPPVVEIKTPIVIHADPKEAQRMDDVAAEVRTRAITYVNDTYDEVRDTVNKWVLSSNSKILRMKDDPPSSFGLLATMAGAFAGVVGAAFPELAVAGALVAAAGGTAAAVPLDTDDPRKGATVAMDGLALGVAKRTTELKTAGQKKIDAALKDFDKGSGSMSYDPDVLDKLAQGGDSAIDWIITEKLGFKLAKDMDPSFFGSIESALDNALKRSIKDGKRSKALMHKFGVLQMSMYVKGQLDEDTAEDIREYIDDWDKDHDKDEDLPPD